MEYSDTVWDPTLNKDIKSLEIIQHKAINRLKRQACLPTLQQRQ